MTRWSPPSRKRLPGIQVGTGTGGASEMGPLITREHRDRVAGYLALTPSEGAEVRVDGREDRAADRPGFFLGASLLDRVQPGSRAHVEEIFGPVLSVVRVDTYEQAMEVVGSTHTATARPSSRAMVAWRAVSSKRFRPA